MREAGVSFGQFTPEATVTGEFGSPSWEEQRVCERFITFTNSSPSRRALIFFFFSSSIEPSGISIFFSFLWGVFFYLSPTKHFYSQSLGQW